MFIRVGNYISGAEAPFCLKKVFLMRVNVLIAVLFLGAFLFGCLQNPAEQNTSTANASVDEDGLKAVASFYPIYFFSKEVIGNKGNIVNLVPPGVEPHDFDLTPRAVQQLQSADVIFYNGLGLESWILSAGDSLELTAQFVDTSRGVQPLVGTAGEEEGESEEQPEVGVEEEVHSATDPHIWLDPLSAKQQVSNIEHALVNIDAENSAYYESQANILKAKLDALNGEFLTGLASCAKNEIVTSHAAFGYLAHRYGLNQISISGLSPEVEPSPAVFAEVAEFARTHNIRYIFFETLVSPALAQSLASEVGAEVLVLDPIEGISQENLDIGEDYFYLMRENLKNLRLALECE